MRCHALIHIRWKGSHSYQEATRKINLFAKWDLAAKGNGLLLDGVQQPFKRIILDPFLNVRVLMGGPFIKEETKLYSKSWK